jgi:hypothetical protein
VSFAEILSAAAEAWWLLAAHPMRWLGVVVLFLLAVEALMFIPRIGFVLKLAMASLVGAQVLSMFAASSAGEPPNPLDIFSAFSLPVPAQVALAVAALVPFAIAVLYLYLKAGPASIQFFFGDVLEARPPAPDLLIRFKAIMLAGALPLTLLAGVVVLKGLGGTAAIRAALGAALVNWLPLLLLGVMAYGYEWASAVLPRVLPRAAATAAGGVLLLVYLGWSFAFTYTVSARALGVHALRPAANQATLVIDRSRQSFQSRHWFGFS